MVRRLFFRVVVLSSFVLGLGACAGSSPYMMESEPLEGPGEGKALIHIIRDTEMYIGLPIYVWDGDRFIGASLANSYFQYETDPGKHLFIFVPSEGRGWFGFKKKNAFLEADLEAGKSYYVRTGVDWNDMEFPGPRRALKIMPLNKGSIFKKHPWDSRIKTVDALRDDLKALKGRLKSGALVDSEAKKMQDAKGSEMNAIISNFKEEFKELQDKLNGIVRDLTSDLETEPIDPDKLQEKLKSEMKSTSFKLHHRIFKDKSSGEISVVIHSYSNGYKYELILPEDWI